MNRSSRRSLILGVLLALCAGCSSAPPPRREAPGEEAFASQRLFLGLWEAVGRESGREIGTLRLGAHPASQRLVADLFLSGDPLALPFRVELAPVASGTWGGSEAQPPVALGLGARAEDGTLPALLTLPGSAPETITLRRISLTCPVCAAEALPAAAFCSRCGRDLRLAEAQDVRLRWSGVEAFGEGELRRALSAAFLRPHKIEISDCELVAVDKRQDAAGITSWILLGWLSGFLDWSYELRGTLGIDADAPVPFRVAFELDFFDRHEGGREAALALASLVYPAPLVSEDLLVVGRVALARLVERCLAKVARP